MGSCRAALPLCHPHTRALTLNLILPNSFQCSLIVLGLSANATSLCSSSCAHPHRRRGNERYCTCNLLLFWWDEHRQDVCPLFACALPRDSLVDSNSTWHKVTLDTRGLGEPVLTTATTDGSGLGFGRKAGFITAVLQWGFSAEKLYSLFC